MTILYGDCRDVLATLEPGSVQCVVTSPPYPRQRRYGDHEREIGRGTTVAEWCDELVETFRALRPLLAGDGLVWLNVGDRANGSGGAGGDWKHKGGLDAGPGKFDDPRYPRKSYVDAPGAILDELLVDGWLCRAQIVWAKTTSTGLAAVERQDVRHVNRPLLSHEMIYLLAPGQARSRFFPSALVETGSVWHFPPGGQGPAHLAPFPDELARRCILASTLPGDLVLDPFSGSGTTVRVAESLGRRGVGIELYEPDISGSARRDEVGEGGSPAIDPEATAECPSCGQQAPAFEKPYRHLVRCCGAVQVAR